MREAGPWYATEQEGLYIGNAQMIRGNGETYASSSKLASVSLKIKAVGFVMRNCRRASSGFTESLRNCKKFLGQRYWEHVLRMCLHV